MKPEVRQAVAMERFAAAVETRPARDTSRQSLDEKLPLFARVILLVGSSARADAAARATRRAFPIRGYVGPNGGGKSLAMVNDVLPSLAAGRTVLSTVKLLDGRGKAHPSYVPFTNFDQLLDAEHCDVLMDEIVGIANSRSAASLPVQVQNLLVQLRRRDITLSWTAPNWARADKIIREVTQAVTECRGYYPARTSPSTPDDGSGVRLWAPKRVFRFRTFDTMDFEEWTAGKRDRLDPMAKQWFRGVGSTAFRAYDTLDSVSMVEGGDPDLCEHCGKHKRREYCKGHAERPATRQDGLTAELERMSGEPDAELVGSVVAGEGSSVVFR